MATIRSIPFLWQTSRRTRRPTSTEVAELLALNIALLHLHNQRKITFQLLQKEVLAVLYIGNQILWQKLINTTIPSMLEVRYSWRVQIINEIVNSFLFIKSKPNTADAVATKHPNQFLERLVCTQMLRAPCKRVSYVGKYFLLQHFVYIHKQGYHTERHWYHCQSLSTYPNTTYKSSSLA